MAGRSGVVAENRGWLLLVAAENPGLLVHVGQDFPGVAGRCWAVAYWPPSAAHATGWGTLSPIVPGRFTVPFPIVAHGRRRSLAMGCGAYRSASYG